MTTIRYKNVRMMNIPKRDELKVYWDDSMCKLIHKRCRYKSYHSDIKYHMTLTMLFSVLKKFTKFVGERGTIIYERISHSSNIKVLNYYVTRRFF